MKLFAYILQLQQTEWCFMATDYLQTQKVTFELLRQKYKMDEVSHFQDPLSCVRDTNQEATSSRPGGPRCSFYIHPLPRKSPFSTGFYVL